MAQGEGFEKVVVASGSMTFGKNGKPLERDTESLDVLLSWDFLDCVCDVSAGQENRLCCYGPKGTWQEAAALGSRACRVCFLGEVRGSTHPEAHPQGTGHTPDHPIPQLMGLGTSAVLLPHAR